MYEFIKKNISVRDTCADCLCAIASFFHLFFFFTNRSIPRYKVQIIAYALQYYEIAAAVYLYVVGPSMPGQKWIME